MLTAPIILQIMLIKFIIFKHYNICFNNKKNYACEPTFRNVHSGLAVFGVGGCSIEAKDCSIKVKDCSIRINQYMTVLI